MRILLLLLLLLPSFALAETTTDFYTAPPLPLDLAIIADKDGATDALIGPKGGQIRLTSATGDAFVLTFPEGALLTDTRITATPISQSAGLPAGSGAITGVVLKPDGLQLARTATLEITPKVPVPPEDRLHWGFYGNGTDAFLHVPVLDTDSIVIPIDHFSGAGVSIADRFNLQLDRWRQTQTMDRLRTEIAELVREHQAGRIEWRDVVKAVMDGKRIIVAQHGAIATRGAATCSDIKTGLREIIGAERQSQLIGADPGSDTISVAMSLMNNGFSRCLEEAQQICLATGDLSELVEFAVLFARMQQLLGIAAGDAILDPARTAAVRAAMERCGRYRLTVKASGKWQDMAGVTGTTDYRIEVPIRLKFTSDDLFSFTLEGEAGPIDQTVTFVDEACWKLDRSYAAQPMKAAVQSLEFRKDHRPLRLELNLRAVELMAVVTCPENRFRKTIEHDVAWTVWGVAHRRERTGWTFTLKTLQPGSHPKLFSTSWEGKGQADWLQASDTTGLTLEHVGQ